MVYGAIAHGVRTGDSIALVWARCVTIAQECYNIVVFVVLSHMVCVQETTSLSYLWAWYSHTPKNKRGAEAKHREYFAPRLSHSLCIVVVFVALSHTVCARDNIALVSMGPV
jgi:hypothetical protein